MVETIFPMYERIKGLESPQKSGGPVKAFIHIYLSEKTEGKEKIVIKNIAKKLAGEDIVEEVNIVAGECDIVIKINAESIFELGKFVSENLRKYKGIKKTVTSIILASVK